MLIALSVATTINVTALIRAERDLLAEAISVAVIAIFALRAVNACELGMAHTDVFIYAFGCAKDITVAA